MIVFFLSFLFNTESKLRSVITGEVDREIDKRFYTGEKENEEEESAITRSRGLSMVRIVFCGIYGQQK